MRTPRIFTAQTLSPGPLTLEPEPSRHIARALRMRVGDAIRLFDGSGGEYSASITQIDKRTVAVAIEAFHDVANESPLAVHLGIALSRGERFDWVIQKATELGVASIHPLWTEHTGVKLNDERAARKHDHWLQVATSACEQCGRNSIPTIARPQQCGQWVAEVSAEVRLVLHTATPGENASLQRDAAPTSVDVLIGPEGGLSEQEVETAIAAGFESLQLGPRILRTETAPVAALAIIQSAWGDLN